MFKAREGLWRMNLQSLISRSRVFGSRRKMLEIGKRFHLNNKPHSSREEEAEAADIIKVEVGSKLRRTIILSNYNQ
jgi:hypothetical protein